MSWHIEILRYYVQIMHWNSLCHFSIFLCKRICSSVVIDLNFLCHRATILPHWLDGFYSCICCFYFHSLQRVGIRVVEYVAQTKDDKQTCLMCVHLTLKELAAIVTIKVDRQSTDRNYSCPHFIQINWKWSCIYR